MRASNPGMKIMISVGGGTAGSDPFLYVTQNQNRLETFVDDVIFFLRSYDLDGIDIDWESPWCYSEWNADTHADLMEVSLSPGLCIYGLKMVDLEKFRSKWV